MEEIWKPIPKHDGYEASNLGRVRRSITARILSPNVGNKYGHHYVSIMRQGKKTYSTVHKLVATAFLGPVPPGKVCMHGLGGRLDNSIANLRYGTQQENIREILISGNPNYRGAAKLTDEKAGEIMRKRIAGQRVGALSREYGIDRSQISRMTRGKAYGWVWKKIMEEAA